MLIIQYKIKLFFILYYIMSFFVILSRLNCILYNHNNFAYNLKLNNKQIGWFNFKENNNNCFNSFTYIHYQYLIAPSILDNQVFHNKIICFFSNKNELKTFINKHKEYKLKSINRDLIAFFEKEQ